MNKAFVKEQEPTGDYCPRCGVRGQVVGAETVNHHVPPAFRQDLSDAAYFCPTSECEVVYFDMFDRAILASALTEPAYPKDSTAPICPCFGVTCQDIDRDIAEGGVMRVRAVLEQAKSPAAQCTQRAVNGRSCVPFVQSYYMRSRAQ